MLKIPHEFVWPLVIDGIPFLLKLGVALLLNEGLTNTQAAVRFGVKLNFKGSSGFDMPLPGEAKDADPKIETTLDTDFSFKHAESVGLGPQALLAMVLLTAVALAAGHLLGGPHPEDRAALAVASATRHPGLALLVANANFPEVGVAAVVLAYIVVSGLASIPYTLWVKRHRPAVPAVIEGKT